MTGLTDDEEQQLIAGRIKELVEEAEEMELQEGLKHVDDGLQRLMEEFD